MLAAIITNLQNQPEEPQQLPTVHVDRGGGGQSWPSYEIVDIVGALATFQEIPGEHPVLRAARRHRHVGEVLPRIKQSRENREAAAFMIGVDLGRHVALQEMMKLYDAATTRPQPMTQLPSWPSWSSPTLPTPVPTSASCTRGQHAEGAGGVFGAILISALVVGAVVVAKKLAAR